jgi:hypothetical protein
MVTLCKQNEKWVNQETSFIKNYQCRPVGVTGRQLNWVLKGITQIGLLLDLLFEKLYDSLTV